MKSFLLVALIVLAAVPVVYFVSRYFRRNTYRIQLRVRRTVGAINGFLQETFSGMRIVKAYGKESQYDGYFNKPLADNLNATNSVAVYDAYFPCVMQVIRAATIAAVGSALIVFKVAITPAVGLSLEFAVAVMLMALGTVRFASALRESDAVPLAHLGEPHPHAGEPAFHSHPHTHGDTVHRHPHVHPSPALARALQTVGAAQALRSVGVGLVHGLAGSAAVALLVLSTVGSPEGAVAYLILFGVGTIVGMTAITAVLAVPFAVSGRWLAGGRRALAMGTGLLSLGLGLYLAFQIGFGDGLFLGAPVWIPR